MVRVGEAGPARDAVALGIGLIILAVVFLCTVDAMVKWLAAGYSLTQIIFFRNVFGLLPVFVLAGRQGGIAALATRPFAHLFRLGLVLVLAYGFFWALARMELADATAIFFTVPLFISVLSVVFLGETVGLRRWLAVAVGFAGALLVIKPGTGIFQPAALMVLLTSLCYAALMITNRALRTTETPAAMAFYVTAGAIVVTGLALPWTWTPPSPFDLLQLAGVGIFGGIGQILLVLAFRRAPASVIAPFDYSSLIWAVLYGYLLWDELPDAWTLVGAAVVAGGGLYIMRRERAAAPSAREGESRGDHRAIGNATDTNR